ncbi:MAG: YcaO-like family protein [Kiloniellales bacterium]
MTLDLVRPHLDAMGITRIANVTGLDVIGIPVVMVCRPNSRSISVAQGKGATLEAAKASGVMEAIETFHAERLEGPVCVASYSELRQELPVVDVRRLAQSPKTRFHGDLRIPWVAGREVTTGEAIWLPYEVVHTDYSLPLPEGSGCFPANTNGLASGNCVSEAISHGICEAIERDAVTLWKRRGRSLGDAMAIDPDSVDDPLCQELLVKFREADLDVCIWNATSDIGVATFYSLIVGRRPGFADPEFGSGCHPSRAIALARALTEAAQARTTYIAGVRDDYLPELYNEEVRSRRLQHCRRALSTHRPIDDFRKTPDFGGESIVDDVDWLTDRLRERGLDQVIAVDLTREELGIAVVKVVVPGLEGPDKGRDSDYSPGARARALSEGH